MKKLLFTLTVFGLLLTACAVPRAGGAPPTPDEFRYVPPTETLIPTVVATVTSPAPKSQWISYWDAYYGYGLALPCWWTINPTGEHGGAMTLRSYDDPFFEAHSTKGEWTDMVAPPGAVKMDIAMFENVDINAKTEDAIRESSPPEDEIVSTQPVDLNGHPAFLVEFKDTKSDPPTYAKAYYLRFAADKLLILAAYPTELLESDDVQAIVHS